MVQRFGDKSFAGDFCTTLRFEADILDCEVEGEIPKDLHGTFYRCGGDWLYPPKYAHDAPFSADGYISMFRFGDGRVDYKGRFVRTPRYLANLEAHKQLFGIYRNRKDTDPIAKDINYTLSNTTPLVFAGKLFTLKEDSPPIQIDPHTLETKGLYDFYGKYKSKTFTAHPKIDPLTGEMICFGYQATGDLSDDLFIYVINKQGHVTREWRLKVPYVGMLHDMALTRDYIIIPTCPVATDKAWLDAGNPMYHWNSKLPSYVMVLPRNGTEKDVRWYKGPGTAMVHTLNANVVGNKLILDGPVSDGNPFPFFPDRDGAPFNPQTSMANVRRWTINLDKTEGSWEEDIMFPANLGGLGRIDDRFASLPYRYAYMGCTDFSKLPPPPPGAPPSFPPTNAICRFDMQERKVASIDLGPAGSAQETCFAPKEIVGGKAAEGEGYLVSVYSNFPAQRSELIVHDAQSMQERARVIMPFRLSTQVHGSWASVEDIPF